MGGIDLQRRQFPKSQPCRQRNIVRLKDPEAMKGSGEDIDVSRIPYRITVTVGVLTLLF